MTDAAREGALYAIHHGNDSGVTSASLASGIRAVMGGEDQGSLGAFHCPSWPGSPGAPSSSDAQVSFSGAVPPATGNTTSVTITATCRVPPLMGFLPLPNPMVLKTTVESAAVPQT